MGLKGINAFEQHVEKIVVGVSGAALLAVLAAQFMGSSSMVKVGKGAPVAPADAYKPVEQEAERIAARLESSQPDLPEAPQTAVLDTFKSKLSAAVAPKPTIVALGPTTAVQQAAAGNDTPADAPYAQLQPPPPSEPVAHAFRSTINPGEWLNVEELRNYLPKQQPFDKAAVSVEAVFDGAALKQVLTADPDGDDGQIRPMPLSWWRDNVEIVGVELEREQLQSDGSWSGTTIVKTPPGRVNLIGEVQNSLKGIGDVNPFLARVREVSEEVQRPKYYDTIAGPAWTPPQEAALAGDEPGGAQSPERMAAGVADFDRKIADLETKMAGLPSTPPQRDPGGGGGGGRGGGGGGGGGGDGKGGGGGGGGGRQAGPSPETQNLRDYQKWVALNGQKNRLVAARDTLVGKLAAQGLGPDGLKLAVGAEARPELAQPLLENAAVKVWSHDVTVEPGATYRYRTRVVVNNPMFARADVLLEEQKPLAESQLVRGEWSGWSQPVLVDSDGYFFMVSAQERDTVGGKRATAELYQFYYGYWRKGAVNVEPGDSLVAEAKLPTELPIFDLSKMTALPKQADPIATPVPESDGGEDGGRGVAPGRRGAPPPERPAGPAGPGPVTPGAPLPEGVTYAPSRMAVSVDALFMDVAPVPSATERRLAQGQQLQTYLRNGEGQIITRIPDNERATAVYQRVSQSAKAGETQGRPVVKPVEGPRVPPPAQRDPGGRRPTRDPGGGGGGG